MIKNLSIRFIVIFLSAITVNSCKNTPSAIPKAVNGKIDFPCLRYDSAALEYRLDSIQNLKLVLQTCIMEADDNNTAFQLISYAFDTLGDFNNSWMPDTLRVAQDSASKTFAGRVAIGNTELTREQLYDVLNDSSGKRVSYDYMLFIPVVEGVFHHLVYRIRPVKNGQPAKGNNGRMQMTTPLPPSRVWK